MLIGTICTCLILFVALFDKWCVFYLVKIILGGLDSQNMKKQQLREIFDLPLEKSWQRTLNIVKN